MDIVKVKTKRGLELKGAFFDGNKYASKGKNTVLIMLTGICSNIFQNELLYSTGKLLQKNGVSTIIAHAMDSFSYFAYSDLSSGKQKITGVFDDEFDFVYEDVESYVEYAKNLGFKNIILGGHSLGSNKIIHYLGNTNDNFIDYFIISSPVDITHWWKIMPNIETCFNMAKKWCENGREDDILPFLFGGFSPMKAKTVLGFHNAKNLKNCPVLSGEGEWDSLYSIKPAGSFIIGSKDSVTGESPGKFMEELNLHTKNPNKNQVIELDGASHIFYGMHEIYARTILDCIQKYFKQKPIPACI